MVAERNEKFERLKRMGLLLLAEAPHQSCAVFKFQNKSKTGQGASKKKTMDSFQQFLRIGLAPICFLSFLAPKILPPYHFLHVSASPLQPQEIMQPSSLSSLSHPKDFVKKGGFVTCYLLPIRNLSCTPPHTMFFGWFEMWLHKSPMIQTQLQFGNLWALQLRPETY